VGCLGSHSLRRQKVFTKLPPPPPHPAFHSVDTEGGIPRLRRPKRETGYSSPFIAEANKFVGVSNVLYTYRQNTTVVLDVVYLFISLRHMFRPLLGHHQALWRYIV
jgi:hypothetical protein